MEKKTTKEILQKEEISGSPLKMTTNPSYIKDLENSQKFKKYSGGLDKILQSFDSLHEWADYISFLSKLLKTLHTYPTFTVIPYQDLVAFRLSQCLDPNLPSGVHQKTLEVYSYIFSLIGKNGLSESLSLWTSGLAPVLMFASTKIKPYFLGLIETFYLPLGPSLRSCAKSLIMSLLPGLEEEPGEYFDETFSNDSQKLEEIFGILLSLMDKPDIGSIVIPDIFLPAIRTIYLFSESSNDDLYNNALSHARAFLNSVDLKLIWSKILSLVDERYESDMVDYKFALYMISNFNLHEDMVFFHIPMAFQKIWQLKKNKYADRIKDIENVILEYTKGPLRKTLRKEVFLLIRGLIVYMSSVHLASLWAIILLELQHCFRDLLEKDLPWNQEFLDLLLDACKLLDVIL
ncbi:hypothetical protein PCK2_000454, partial [Pneumocystis canis]